MRFINLEKRTELEELEFMIKNLQDTLKNPRVVNIVSRKKMQNNLCNYFNQYLKLTGRCYK